MVSYAEIGRGLGVTRMQAGRLVRQGCPTTSIQAAMEWREENPPRRAPVNGRALDPDRMPTLVKKVTQLTSVRQKAEVTPHPAKEEKPVKKKVPKLPAKTGDSLQDALNNAKYVADRAFEEYLLACESDSATRPLRLSEHSKALDARLKAEKAVREEMERREMLANKAVVFQAARTACEAVLRRLKRLPLEIGPQCNPENPLMATKLLEREVTTILAVGAKSIMALQTARHFREGCQPI
jgi:hypothetical protein